MFRIPSALAICAVSFALALTGCGKPGGSSTAATSISGAGATFPAPVYAQWAGDYKAAGGAEINYQAIGSGAGINQIESKTVDFGASDKPLKPDSLEKNGLYQFPTVMGGVVVIVNLPNIASGQLKITGPVLADIYAGKVKAWNDPAIAALNAGTKLPGVPISVIHRSDGSGTSFLFTSYLAAVSPDWAAKIGGADTAPWPVGIGGKGNDGVAAAVKGTGGSIGYVEFAYAKQNNLSVAQLKNKDGQFVSPAAEAFAAAAANADWAHAQGNYLLLLDQAGAASWPITGATFILLHKVPDDPAQAAGVLKFFDWAYKNGDAAAAKLNYVPLPQAAKDLVRGQWSQIKGADGKPVYAPS